MLRFNFASSATEKQYHISSWLFIRLIALIYLVAFASLAVQVTGLIGSHGILPVNIFLQNAEHALGSMAWFRIPTLLWVNSSDIALMLICYAGIAFSFLLFIGRYQLLSSI